jgi:hypothetical protein
MDGTCLLSLLWEAGYKVSLKKAQIFQNTIKYLGFHLSQGQCKLSPERKQAVCSIPAPKICGKSESFWKPWVYAKSGSLTILSWLSLSMKPQRGRMGTLAMRRGTIESL